MDYVTVLIYEEDASLISRLVLQYPSIETGGDLFGLWQTEREAVVQLAIGPGKNCRRTPTSFFQDEQYLSTVGNYLTSTEGMCNIGEWHSHHSLNLPEPSGGDKQTIWRHMPRYGLERFLLLITTINRGRVDMHSFMFLMPRSGDGRRGGMVQTKYKVLPGPNPFRAESRVMSELSLGVEKIDRRSWGIDEFDNDKEEISKEKLKKTKKKIPKKKKNKGKRKFWGKWMKNKKGNYQMESVEKTSEAYESLKQNDREGRLVEDGAFAEDEGEVDTTVKEEEMQLAISQKKNKKKIFSKPKFLKTKQNKMKPVDGSSSGVSVNLRNTERGSMFDTDHGSELLVSSHVETNQPDDHSTRVQYERTADMERKTAHGKKTYL